jgi:hypothetical protein
VSKHGAAWGTQGQPLSPKGDEWGYQFLCFGETVWINRFLPGFNVCLDFMLMEYIMIYYDILMG